MNNIIRPIIFYIVIISILFAQNIIEETGVSLDGSTGLILNPSSETLGVGHVRIGSSVLIPTELQYLDKKIPFSVALGLTTISELYYSTNTWHINNLESEANNTLGLKIKVLSLNKSNISVDLRGQYIDLLKSEKLISEDRRIIGRVITNFMLFNLRTYSNIGYILSLEPNGSNTDRRIIGGLGIIFPIMKNLQGIVDFNNSELESVDQKINGSLALKMYLFNHVQLATGINANFNGSKTFNGMFMNISVSSEVLKGPRKRIRTQRGLPIPPKLPINYLESIKSNQVDELKGEELNVVSYPLNVYVENFLERNYKDELPIITPLNQIEKWKERVFNNIDNNRSNQTVLEMKDLPFPPKLNATENLDKIEPSKRIENIEEYLLDIELLTLPKPPSLESLDD